MAITPVTDGPPPSPATNPAAAQETGQRMPVDQLAGGANRIQMSSQGPDLSGILTLVQKLDQGLLSLAGAVPDGGQELNAARDALAAFAARFMTQSGQNNGSMPGASPKGQVVSQSGNQFPGSVTAGKPF